MCFSASASFGAGAVLLTASVFTLKRVQSPSQIAFASIPLFFSIQQFTEGIVWLSLTNKSFEFLEPYSTHFFLIFAQVVWPVMVPLSIYLLEKDLFQKKILLFILGVGSMLSVYLVYCLVVYSVKAEIISYHIHYTLNFPLAFIWLSGVFYFIPTVVPPFISSHKRIPLLGCAIVGSYIFTVIFYTNYVISVWCFFAAIISVIVLNIVTELNKSPNKIKTNQLHILE